MCGLCAGIREARAATLHLSWASDTEADIEGYRLRYGTAPGGVDGEVDAGPVTGADVKGLFRGVLYYFSVVAYDVAGNESAPSTEVTARLATDLSAPPLVDSAMEMSSHSIYAVRSIAKLILVRGLNFDAGATVDMGADVTTFPPTRTPNGDLLVGVTVPGDAAPGPRSISVSNPDLGIGSGSDMITIVKSPDANHDCSVDIIDLNTLARAWNERAGEARFAPAVDLDGDDYVGPDDLTVFVNYFGLDLTGCP
jgi:hypothetical protein